MGPVCIITTSFGRILIAGSPQIMAAEQKNIYANYSTLSDRSIFFSLNEGETIIKSSETDYHYRMVLTSSGHVLGWGNPYYLGMGDRWKDYYVPESLYITSHNILNQATYYYSQTLQYYQLDIEGYQFMGWFIDEALEIPFDLTFMPDKDLMIYGHYVLLEETPV